MIGRLYKVFDKFWVKDYKRGFFFAWNRPGDGVHPAVIKSASSDGFTFQLSPGTSKRQLGSCIFKTSIVKDRDSYFLLNKSLPVTHDELQNFSSGWSSQMKLSEAQLDDMKLQNEFCLGKKNVN